VAYFLGHPVFISWRRTSDSRSCHTAISDRQWRGFYLDQY